MDLVVVACLLLIFVGIVGFLVARMSGGGASAAPVPAPTASASGSAPAAQKEDDSHLYHFNIYYGSQTGTAEGFAKQISNEARARGFKGTLVDLEDFETDMVTTASTDPSRPTLAMFIMATYGEGDPTDNAVDFVQWVKDKDNVLAPGSMDHLRFTVFGLGNRQYEHYNAMGRMVNERLAALGGKEVYKYGEGDDDGTLEEDFDAWKQDLWDGLAASLGVASAGAGSGAEADELAFSLPQFEWKLVHVGAPDASVQADLAKGGHKEVKHVDMASRHYFSAVPLRVVRHEELRQTFDDCNSTTYVELDLEGSGLTYGTADDLAVLPENAPSIVEPLAKWLGYDLDQWFTLEAAEGLESPPKPIFPTPCTVRTALTRYCDLSGLPRKQLLGYLSNFAEKSDDRERLRHLAGRDGKADFHDWAVAAQRGVYEVFQEFQSVKPPLGVLLQLLPRLAVRYYTIASSSVVHPTTVQLAVSVIRGPKPGGHKSRQFSGVCSSFFMDRTLPDPATTETKSDDPVGRPGVTHVVYADMRASNFKLPADPSVAVLMVGPGTGVAPMRAFLQERKHQKANSSSVGETVLFFGCRRQTEDYIFRDELEGYLADGTLDALHNAFSREQDHKVYVQHRLREQGEEVWRLLSSGAHVYVCGATLMGEDVKAALIDVVGKHGGVADPAAFVQKLRDDERYIQELWS